MILVVSTEWMGDDFRMGKEVFRWISVQTVASLYPKCAISQTTKSQRSIGNELQYKAMQELISISEKMSDDFLVI